MDSHPSSMESFPSSNSIEKLTEVFRDLRVWDYYSISKFKNSMYCPDFLQYLSEGVRPRKIETPEGAKGSLIHEKLDVTEKVEAEPWEAAVHNVCAILESLFNSYKFDESSVLTELPYFSPMRKIYGYPDVLLFHNNGELCIELIERKTRMKRIAGDDMPFIFADDLFQLHVQRELLSDILSYSSMLEESFPFNKVKINSMVELRRRDICYENPGEKGYTEQLETSLLSLSESGIKDFDDNYFMGFSVPVTYNLPGVREEPVYCRVDIDSKPIRDRFSYVEKVLLSESQATVSSDCRCNSARKRYCGYSHLCRELENQMSLNRFISP